MSIHNRVVIITGTGHGVGRATARSFAREGVRVVLFSCTRAHLDETAAQIARQGGQAPAIAGGVACLRRRVYSLSASTSPLLPH